MSIDDIISEGIEQEWATCCDEASGYSVRGCPLTVDQLRDWFHVANAHMYVAIRDDSTGLVGLLEITGMGLTVDGMKVPVLSVIRVLVDAAKRQQGGFRKLVATLTALCLEFQAALVVVHVDSPRLNKVLDHHYLWAHLSTAHGVPTYGQVDTLENAVPL